MSDGIGMLRRGQCQADDRLSRRPPTFDFLDLCVFL
jgi:hypothetical protein